MTSRPSAWYTPKDFETWENDSGWPRQSSSSQGRTQDNKKGWKKETPKGKGQNRCNSETDTNIVPREECMALAGTNQSCKICINEHWQHLEKLSSSFRSISKFQQPVLPSFPCPAQLQDGVNCSGVKSVFGKGECLRCMLFRDYLFKMHSQRNPPLSPYISALYIGYERSVIFPFWKNPHMNYLMLFVMLPTPTPLMNSVTLSKIGGINLSIPLMETHCMSSPSLLTSLSMKSPRKPTS